MIVGMDQRPEIIVVDDAAALAETAARAIVEPARRRRSTARGRFILALAGGGTPRTTYERLAQPPLRESDAVGPDVVFFGDERGVAPDHRDSNYRMANAVAAVEGSDPGRAGLPHPGRGRAIPRRPPPSTRGTLSEVFGTKRGELPRFDLVLLGMGVDGHTARCFPARLC